MPPTARIVLDRDFTIADVPRRIFGSFVEHMGRSVYSGIFEPNHPAADARGFRTDVLDLVRELGPTIVRYPGGNFVSGYRWEDGTGPVESRPRRLDGAWHAIESNHFGLHEFVEWAKLAGVEVMEAVNLGTRGIEAARELVEYANHPGGTHLSELRKRNGAAEPFDIRTWCLGNELDAEWQIGHKTADEYGRLAAETGRAMRMVDPTIELVAVGSSNSGMSTFGSWEHTVLGHAYDVVDYISLHAYYQEEDGDAESFLASSVDMDHFIESVIATADAVRAAGRHEKRIDLSFDEWNVWYQRGRSSDDQLESVTTSWRESPRLIEDDYSVTDAVVVGTLLNSLLRHGDRVKIANQAQLVNVIAPIRADAGGPAWRQTTFWPFARMSRLATGRILRAAVRSDRVDTKAFGDVDVVDVSATWDEGAHRVRVFLANRDLENAADIEVVANGWTLGAASGEYLATPEGGTRHSTNDRDHQPVRMRPLSGVTIDGTTVLARIPALSWCVLELVVETA